MSPTHECANTLWEFFFFPLCMNYLKRHGRKKCPYIPDEDYDIPANDGAIKLLAKLDLWQPELGSGFNYFTKAFARLAKEVNRAAAQSAYRTSYLADFEEER